MARKPVTVSLPDGLVRDANRFCRKRAVTLSEVTRDAIREYLVRKELDQVREGVSRRLQRSGILSEKELLKRLED
jgi:metal-responsive CopG/Arc/MetJ family transcriptional regulator